MSNHVLNGYIYENGCAKEINFLSGNIVTIQAIGTGSYQLFGKMRGGTYTEIPLIDSEFNLVDKGENQKLYSANVDGLSFITVRNIEGEIDKIFFDIHTGDKISVNKSGGGSITVDDEMSLTSTNPVQNKVITAAVNQKPDRIEIDSVVDSAVDDALQDNTATDEEVEDMTEHLDDL